MRDCPSIFRLLILVFLLSGFIQSAKGQATHLQFDRISVELSVNDSDLANQEVDSFLNHRADLIDTLFSLASSNLMEFERLLGYKLTGQLHVRLFVSAPEYQKALQTHPVWLERYQSDFLGMSTNHYPVYFGTSIEEIRIQLRYIIAHFTLNEFLNGSSIRQKMTQSGYQDFPSWIFQGLCAHWANGWTITAQDEFQYYRDKGAFRYPNLIEPLSAQTFGRYVWHLWIQSFGNAAMTNFWFVLKYTGQSSTAVEFLLGESFGSWYSSVKDKIKPQSGEKTESEFQINTHRGNSPVLNMHSLGNGSQNYLIQLFVPDEECWILRERQSGLISEKTLYRNLHAKLIPESAIYLRNPQGLNCDVVSKSVEKFVLENTSIEESSVVASDSKKSVIQLVQLVDNQRSVLWRDTLPHREISKDLIIESNDVISYIQSKDNQWFINFTKLNDSTITRWSIPVLGGFAQQFKDSIPQTGTGILQVSFLHDENLLRWMESGNISAVEIKEMMRKFEKPIDSARIFLDNMPADSLDVQTPRDTWTYLSPFPYKNLNYQRKSIALPIYNRGKFTVTQAKSAMMLDRGGLFLGNEEPEAFPNSATIDPNSLYNHPLTPELRFYLSNPRFGHKIKAGILSNLPMSRIAIRMEQAWVLGDWTLKQAYYHRSRQYYLREFSLFQNLGDKIAAGLTKSHGKNLQFSADWYFQRDIQFQKINRPFSVLKSQNVLSSQNVMLSAKAMFEGKSPRKHLRTEAFIQGTTGIHRYNTSAQNMDYGIDFQLVGQLKKSLFHGLYVQTDVRCNSSTGKVRNQYWVGGSQGWINPEPWNTTYQALSEKENLYGYRMVGGYVRGFYAGARLGHSAAVANVKLSVRPYALLHKNLSKSDMLQRMEIYGFFDAGTAYIGRSPSATQNPFNLEQINSPNYRLEVFAKRNPWIAGTGFGVSSEVLKMPIRYEVAWGLKEGKILSPIQHVCMTWNF